MNGLLGLPPGLQGIIASQQMRGQQANDQLQQLGGILNIQNQLEMKPMQAEMMRIQLQNAQAVNNIRNGLLNGGAPSLAYGEGGISTPGGQANLQTGQTQSASSGQFGIDPRVMSMLLSGDPGLEKTAAAILEQQKPINVRPGGTVYTPGKGAEFTAPQGGINTTWGPGGPSQALVPGAAATKTELSNVPLPGAPTVKLPLSGGQTAELTQPEYLKWQQSGQLPPRYGPSGPQPMQIPPAEQARRDAEANNINQNLTPSGAAPAIPTPKVVQGSQAGLGVPGLTQSQGDIINQKRQTAAGTAVDEAFGKDYPTFINGGVQDATKQLAQLKDVTSALQTPGAQLTGPIIGSTPNAILKFTNPQSIAMRERVEEVVQRSLRAILGAQFTEKEGERLIARAYNPNLSEGENAIRVNRLYTQLNQALENKKDAAIYFQKNGTLEGWSGKLPSISDFDPTPQRRAGEGWSIRPVQ